MTWWQREDRQPKHPRPGFRLEMLGGKYVFNGRVCEDWREVVGMWAKEVGGQHFYDDCYMFCRWAYVPPEQEGKEYLEEDVRVRASAALNVVASFSELMRALDELEAAHGAGEAAEKMAEGRP